MTSENINTVRITSISLTGNSQTGKHILRIYIEDKIEYIHKKAIHCAWDELICCRKRQLEVGINEISIYLKKGDSVQKYIDYISGIVSKVNYFANSSRSLKLKRQKKDIILKRMRPSKVYSLARLYKRKMT